MAPRRRQSDLDGWITKSIPGAVKAMIGILLTGGLSFLGTWGYDTSKSIASLQEQMHGIQDKQDLLGPWIVDQMKEENAQLLEIRQELATIKGR